MIPVLPMVFFWLLSDIRGGVQSEILCAPNITLEPSLGILERGNATIKCWSPLNLFMNFSLERHDISHDITIATQIARGMAAFHITNVSRERGGLYSCYYYNNLFRSNHSEQVKLMIIDPTLGKPNISFSSMDQITLGSNFTICCQSPHEDVEFYFQNANTQVTHQTMANNFIVSKAEPRHGGNYQCSYHRPLEPFISSEPSSSLLLLLTDLSLSRPNIFQRPSDSIALGGRVQIQCQPKDGATSFYFYKAGGSKAEGPMPFPSGELSISNVSLEHKGNFSCIYGRKPFLVSKLSTSLELLVSGIVSYLVCP
ncbi:T-cell-interacting, activating receptor on myeloid cells protein 1-like [Podarcis muralis]